MKTTIAFLFAAFCGCAAWHPIANQNSAVLTLDGVLYRDVGTLVAAKNEGTHYQPALYGSVFADITNCQNAYAPIPNEGVSIAQLGDLANAVQIFKTQDSSGAPESWFQVTGSNILHIAHEIDTTEAIKLP